MLHRCKNGVTALFTSMEHCAKKAFCQILKRSHIHTQCYVIVLLQHRQAAPRDYFLQPVHSLLCNCIIIAQTGGTAGLFLGASLLTVMEFGEFFLLIAISLLKQLTGNTKLEQKDHFKDNGGFEESSNNVK